MAAEKEYKLSTELYGHNGDIRAVITFTASGGDEYIVTASRDRSAIIWRRDNIDYIIHKRLAQHKGYVSSLCAFTKDSSVVIATGSQDSSILIHSMDPLIPDPLQTFNGHSSLVSSLIHQNTCLISGAWDSSVRVWSLNEEAPPIIIPKAHEPAVWTLAGLYEHDNTHRILSGGADKMIRLWELSTSVCIQEYQGHSDVVRDIKITSTDSFLSAANDCTIRQWNTHTGHCMRELHGHEAYVYSISLLPDDGFASCGEDSTLRIWKGSDCVQIISLPCISVWAVACSNDGNCIVTGSSDSIGRVFTVNPSLMASEQHQSTFHSQVQVFQSSRNKDTIDVSKLPVMSEALSNPGQKTGDTKLVNNNGKPEVYQWDADSLQWVKIGDAIGQAPTNSKEYMGVEYDYLFDIEIDDGNGSQMRKLKLPYNKTEDPYMAAERFMEVNQIPVWYLDQIAEFIMKNADVQYVSDTGITDPFTGGARYVPGGAGEEGLPLLGSGGPAHDPFTGGSRYTPSTNTQGVPSTTRHYPIECYVTFTSTSQYVSKIITKLREFNSTNPLQCIITEEQLTIVNELCVSVISSHPPRDVNEQLSLINKLLIEWPQNTLFPVLDVLRLAVLERSCAVYITEYIPNFIQLLNRYICGSDAKNLLLSLKIIVNLFSTLPEWINAHSKEVYSVISTLLDEPEKLNKTQQTSLAGIIVNFSYYSRDKVKSELVALIIKVLSLSQIHNDAIYSTLRALGTLIIQGNKIQEFPPSLNELLASLLTRNDDKISECCMMIMEAIPTQQLQ